jgi:hypothetical protein
MAAGILSTTSLYAKANENIVNSIMKLRGDVEALYSKIDENKEMYKSQMKSLAMQKADNEAQINRKKTAIAMTDAKIASLEEKVAAQKSNDAIVALVKEAIASLEETIRAGFPFKVEERLADLKKIEEDMEQKRISPEKALALTWASYDDLLRLTKEIGIFKQQIDVKGKKKLAKVAKIGSVMLFFVTPDEEYGYVTKEGKQYHYTPVTDEKKSEEIAALFDALKKQIRTGYFTIPNALIAEGVK